MSISIFNRNLSVRTNSSLILDFLSKSNQRQNDRINSLLPDELRSYTQKGYNENEKWIWTESGLRLKIEMFRTKLKSFSEKDRDIWRSPSTNEIMVSFCTKYIKTNMYKNDFEFAGQLFDAKSVTVILVTTIWWWQM